MTFVIESASRLAAHMKAAAALVGREPGEEDEAVVKGDSFYGGYLSTLGDADRERIVARCGEQGFEAEFGKGPSGERNLRLRKLRKAT